MKKTLAVVLAALLSVACFATIGSAATTVTLNSDDYPNVEANADLSLLVDGTTLEGTEFPGSGGYATSGIVLFKNLTATDAEANTTLCLVVDLGEDKTISAATVYFYKEYVSMVGLGVENTMTISYSTDGDSYTKINDFTFDSEPAMTEGANTGICGIFSETFDFGDAVTARYLEFKLPFEASDPSFTAGKVVWEFIGMTEIDLTEGEPAPDEDSSSEAPVESTEAPVESTEAPVESSETESSTPSTGDAGIVAVAAVALIAIAGAAVVIKKRA